MFGDPRLPERFWDKVMPEPNTGCWLWTGHTNPSMGPLLRTPNGHALAHHVVFRAFIGVPGRDFATRIFRSCGEIACCNPDHLYARPLKDRAKKEYKRDEFRVALVSGEVHAGDDHRLEIRRECEARWRAANKKTANRVLKRLKSKHPERYLEYSHRKRLKQYRLTAEQFDEMWQTQNGCCAICLDPFSSDPDGGKRKAKGASIDHCHISGNVRGLLCGSCNLGIGMFKDKPDALGRAIEYLRKAGVSSAS